MSYYGIDISRWQPEVNFDKVKAEGWQYVIMRCSNRLMKDNMFEKHYCGARMAGLPVGVYTYVRVYTIEEAKAQAEYVVKLLEGKNIECGVWLDMEEAAMRSLGKSMLMQIIEAEASIIKSAGYRVGIYCNLDWYMNVIDGSHLSTKYPMWIAKYGANTGKPIESSEPPAYNIWQYTSKGKVAGIEGNVDCNVSKTNVRQLMCEFVATSKPYTQAQFIQDVKTILQADTVQEAFDRTISISKNVNKKHPLVTPLERYMKELNYYTGIIEADCNRTPVFGSGMASAIATYQKEVVGSIPRYCDGIVTAKANTWAKLLGLR